MVASPRLDHGHAAVQGVVDFHEAHEDKIIHNRADGKIRHVARYPEELGIFVIKECGHQPVLAVGYQRVKKVAVHGDFAEGGAITGHTINHQALNVMLLNDIDDSGVVGIDIQLLRTLEIDMKHARSHLFVQVQADGLGIADDLLRVLIKRNQQSPSLLLERSFS